VLPLAALHHFGNWKGSEEKVCTTCRLYNGFQKISFGRSRDKIEQQIVAENARTCLGQISLKKTSIVTGTSEQARPSKEAAMQPCRDDDWDLYLSLPFPYFQGLFFVTNTSIYFSIQKIFQY
jgi:hypothetical protein